MSKSFCKHAGGRHHVQATCVNCFAIVAGGLHAISHQTTQKGRIWLLYPAPFLYWDKNETQHPRVSFEFRLLEQFCLTFVPSCVAMYRHIRFPYKVQDDMEMPRYSIYWVGIRYSKKCISFLGFDEGKSECDLMHPVCAIYVQATAETQL